MRCLATPRATVAAAGALPALRRRRGGAGRQRAPAHRRCAAEPGSSADVPRSRAEWLDWGGGAGGPPPEGAQASAADAGWSQGGGDFEEQRRWEADSSYSRPRRSEQGAPPERGSEQAASPRAADGEPPLADVTPLSRTEQQALLPVSATGAQYAYYWGAFDTALQRFFVSLFGGLVTSGAPLIAVPAGLYFLWAPVALAARRNMPLRRYPYAGLWHARVLQAGSHSSRSPGGITFDAMGDAFLPKRRTSSVTRVLIGDESGARLQMEVPYEKEHSSIRPGDDVELLVVSDEPQLQRFRAVREAYLPELGMWVSEYPFSERLAFRSISDAIAAEREQRTM